MRDIILRAVEAAVGWQFIPSHSFIKIPGLTEPADVLRIGPVVLSGLAAQLISQLDDTDNYTFHSDMDGRCTVINIAADKDHPERSSYHGESRAVNALRAMNGAGFF